MSSKFADAYLRNIVRTYRTYKEMAERAIASPNWKTLSIPKGQSAEAGAGAVKR